MLGKLKSLLTDDAFFVATLVLLVGFISFGLGRQSVVGKGAVRPAPQAPAGVIFTDAPGAEENFGASPVSTETKVVGSRSGTKYHLPSCPGAAQIKEENKIFFDSVELARAAGYAPAANCPGLQ